MMRVSVNRTENSIQSFLDFYRENYQHFYVPDEINKIDWNPSPINCEQIKILMMQNAVNRVRDNIFDIQETNKLSDYWLSRTKSEYNIEGYDETLGCIKNFGSLDGVKYAFWGMTVLTEMVNTYIKNHFPNAKPKHEFDKYRKIEFDGLTNEWFGKYEPEKLKNLFIFVTASAATNEAKEFFRKIKKNDNYCLFYEQFVK